MHVQHFLKISNIFIRMSKYIYGCNFFHRIFIDLSFGRHQDTICGVRMRDSHPNLTTGSRSLLDFMVPTVLVARGKPSTMVTAREACRDEKTSHSSQFTVTCWPKTFHSSERNDVFHYELVHWTNPHRKLRHRITFRAKYPCEKLEAPHVTTPSHSITPSNSKKLHFPFIFSNSFSILTRKLLTHTWS